MKSLNQMRSSWNALVTLMLNKNTLGAKNREANQKQQLNGYTCDQNVWYLAKAKNYTEYTWVTCYIDNALAMVFSF